MRPGETMATQISWTEVYLRARAGDKVTPTK